MIDIKTVKDVEAFFTQLLTEDLNFHPDEDFINYINIDSQQQTYTSEEAEERNLIMDKCFVVCEKADIDIYAVAQELSLKWTGLDRYISLPSSLKL